MGDESTVSEKAIVPEGENPFEDGPYISPDVLAAMAGERVDFSQHLGVVPDPVEEDEPEVPTHPTEFATDIR